MGRCPSKGSSASIASEWRVEFERTAEKSFGKLDRQTQVKLRDALRHLAVEMNTFGRPATGTIIKLKGSHDRFRLRVGDWRVIFRFEHNRLIVLVLELGHRSDIYRALD